MSLDPIARRQRAERTVYGWSLGLVVALAGAAVALPGELGTIVARRGYGFFSFWYLTIVLLSTPWARFHRTRRVGRVIALREALGNATVFFVAGHVFAMGLLEPVYFIDYANPEDVPGLVSSLIVAVLALTSLPGIRRRIGAARWKRIHRWIFVAWGSIVLVVVMSRPWTAIPHLLVVFVVLGYRIALWRQRRKTPRTRSRADRVNDLLMTLGFVAVVLLSGREALKEGLGIGLFSGIGG